MALKSKLVRVSASFFPKYIPVYYSQGVEAAFELNVSHDASVNSSGRAVELKRAFDVVFSAAVLLLLSPLLLLLAAGLLIADGRPIFFRQNRIGLGGRTFGCLKFRTMVRDADKQLQALLATSEESRREWAETQKLKNDPRIHWIGRILRKTSLDELPQFINVLMGDMSVVGPRPIVRDEVARYGKDFSHYASVRPGVTGLWQVSGRNSLSYADRVALDAHYARNVAPLEDARIIVKTVAIVLSADGDH